MATSALSRGRPREFDQEEVLDAVVELFWEKGYEATSVNDIVEVTGLNKSSLFNAFGSKDALFERALGRYVDGRTEMITALLHQGTAGLDDLLALVELLWAEVSAGGDHRGCLAVNTSTELGLRDDKVVEMGERYRSLMRGAVTEALERAAERGEIGRDSVADYANLMVSFMLGASVVVRSGASNDEIRAYVDSARTMIESWRG